MNAGVALIFANSSGGLFTPQLNTGNNIITAIGGSGMTITNQNAMTNLTVTDLQAMKHSGEKIACLTAYDATFAAVLDAAGVDVQLVGDSLGMVLQGPRIRDHLFGRLRFPSLHAIAAEFMD